MSVLCGCGDQDLTPGERAVACHLCALFVKATGYEVYILFCLLLGHE